MSEFIESMQFKIKNSSTSILLTSAKLAVGLFLGLTFALVAQRLFGLGDFSFALIIIVTAGLFSRLVKAWTFISLGIFAFICVLVALLLKMYILVAPGA